MDFYHRMEGMEMYFVHFGDCQSSLMNTMFIVATKLNVVYPIQVFTRKKYTYMQIMWLHRVPNPGMYMTILGRWRHCTHLHPSTRCKPY
jgi:hypothetical protein